MPLLSVDDTGASIPSLAGRKQLVVTNEGPDDVRGGWSSDVTNDGTAATDGLLLRAGATLALGGISLDLTDALHFICASGETATLSYAERA